MTGAYIRERTETRWGNDYRNQQSDLKTSEGCSKWTHTDFHQTVGDTRSRKRLCKSLWITEGRLTTEDDLSIQTLGHIQHTCETLSEIHTLTHHRFWHIIHTEIVRLISSKWWFICIRGEKYLRTIWTELGEEFPEIFNLCTVQSLENEVMEQEMITITERVLCCCDLLPFKSFYGPSY